MTYPRIRQAIGALYEQVDDALYTCKQITEIAELSMDTLRDLRAVGRKLVGVRDKITEVLDNEKS